MRAPKNARQQPGVGVDGACSPLSGLDLLSSTKACDGGGTDVAFIFESGAAVKELATSGKNRWGKGAESSKHSGQGKQGKVCKIL